MNANNVQMLTTVAATVATGAATNGHCYCCRQRNDEQSHPGWDAIGNGGTYQIETQPMTSLQSAGAGYWQHEPLDKPSRPSCPVSTRRPATLDVRRHADLTNSSTKNIVGMQTSARSQLFPVSANEQTINGVSETASQQPAMDRRFQTAHVAANNRRKSKSPHRRKNPISDDNNLLPPPPMMFADGSTVSDRFETVPDGCHQVYRSHGVQSHRPNDAIDDEIGRHPTHRTDEQAVCNGYSSSDLRRSKSMGEPEFTQKAMEYSQTVFPSTCSNLGGKRYDNVCDVMPNDAIHYTPDNNGAVVISVEALQRLLINNSLYYAARPLLATHRLESRPENDVMYDVSSRRFDTERNIFTVCTPGSLASTSSSQNNAKRGQRRSDQTVRASDAMRNEAHLQESIRNGLLSGHRRTTDASQQQQQQQQPNVVPPTKSIATADVTASKQFPDPSRLRVRVGGSANGDELKRLQQRRLRQSPPRLVSADASHQVSDVSSKHHSLLPGPPTNVLLTVSGRSSLYVQFDRPAILRVSDNNDDVIARYCVEWSYFENFSRIVGSRVIADFPGGPISCQIDDLEPGNRYYVRVRAGNSRGFGQPAISNPPSATPSNWRDFEEVAPRFEGKLHVLEGLYENLMNVNNCYNNNGHNVNSSRPANTSSSVKNVETSSSKMRKTIKNLFSSSTVKLQKTLKRGLYVASVVHHDGRILVTGDDVIPTVEVESEFTTQSLSGDLYWLMKVTSSWYEIKSMQQQMSKCTSSSSLQFRSRLLHAITQLQASLGLHDLGQFHYSPVVDQSSGVVVLVTVRSLSDAKAVDLSRGVRWMAIRKAVRRSATAESGLNRASAASLSPTSPSESSISSPSSSSTSSWHVLMDAVQEMVVERCLGSQILSRGLYVGFLRLTCGVGSVAVPSRGRSQTAAFATAAGATGGSAREAVGVVVPRHQPNVLPYVKVRDNPNITSEEWRWLVNEKLQANSLWLSPLPRRPTDSQSLFETELRAACDRLLEELGEEPLDSNTASGFRLYDVEVLELNGDVSFVVVLPPSERVCNSPLDVTGVDRPAISDETFTCLPVQAFELLNLQAYQPELTRRYCQLSFTIDVELSVVQHELRLALLSDDIDRLRRRVDDLNRLQSAAVEVWKSVRWLPDLTGYARDRSASVGVGLVPSNSSPWMSNPGGAVSIVNGLPLSVLFAPPPPTPVRNHHQRPSTNEQPSPSSVSSGVVVVANKNVVEKSSEMSRTSATSQQQLLATAEHAVPSSVVGSDSDYHSDISNFSSECLQAMSAVSPRHYQPVLL